MKHENWSAPDGDGIMTCNLKVGAVSTLRGRRKRRAQQNRTSDVVLWPDHWRDLLKDWLKQKSARRKWTNLLKVAGGKRVNDAWQIMHELLKAGLIEIEERRETSRWEPVWVEFLGLEAVRELVGLTNRETLRQQHSELGETPLNNADLAGLQASLQDIPAERAIRRHEILVALDQWIDEERIGTRRDFALFARGDTKGISSAEWAWVEDSLSMEEIGISKHTPALWLRAPLSLITNAGKLDLHCVPDCIGLTPETIAQVVSIEGKIGCWRILENRTVFERVARQRGATDGVIWVPGFAPSWWRAAATKLLSLCPKTALVACDPDPAGIEIALSVGEVWTRENFSWDPWHMDIETLSSLKQRKPLGEDDHARLKRLLSQPLSGPLKALATWMVEHGEKGEQEGAL